MTLETSSLRFHRLSLLDGFYFRFSWESISLKLLTEWLKVPMTPILVSINLLWWLSWVEEMNILKVTNTHPNEEIHNKWYLERILDTGASVLMQLGYTTHLAHRWVLCVFTCPEALWTMPSCISEETSLHRHNSGMNNCAEMWLDQKGMTQS